MASTDSLILVVNRAATEAEHIKALIEFMDTPSVETATPNHWRDQLGDHRLEALFVGPDLSDKDISTLMDDVGRLDPNVPIVLVGDLKGS